MTLIQKPIDWAKATWTKSWTTTWAKAQVGAAAITGSLSALYPWVSDPTLKGYLDALHTPTWTPAVLGGLGLVTWVAHGRETA